MYEPHSRLVGMLAAPPVPFLTARMGLALMVLVPLFSVARDSLCFSSACC